MTATAWAAPATAVAASVAPTPLQYVALGDSYAAGYGSAPTRDNCGRTPAAYPALLARSTDGAVALRNAACINATVADVTGRQLAALNHRTALVTVTVGANDLNVKEVLQACLSPMTAMACRTGNARINRTLAVTLPREITRMIQAIRAAAPNARIVVTGYPLPFAKAARCADMPIPAKMRARVNQVAARLNAVIAAAADRARVRFADVEKAFARHGVCSARPWLVGTEGMRDNTVLHPTAVGHERGYLPAIAETGFADRF
ncbi:hypothetical protein MB27_26325 [Actinoplanes utahensis]|uniref:SGNH hydrolase-type esterase domain-containing protein n=1 Tax=Actinoplanes utahensis TaxID=1869 RepID=A0A0A6X454_ACTUT|nr:hypothetical protein MB27_26325 [Actinoplanes utahensis]